MAYPLFISRPMGQEQGHYDSITVARHVEIIEAPVQRLAI